MLLTLKSVSFSIFALLLLSAPLHAQPTASPASDQPLEISADKALEWDRANSKYFARGNAIAKQGDMQVQADTLVADYRDANGRTEIYRFTATGNVILTSGANKAYGEQAVYEVESGKAVLTGKDLRIEATEMKLTAQERFEYYANEGRMVAIGSPVITNKDSTLQADTITAWTADKSAGSDKGKSDSQLGNLKRAEATGNVVITTPKEKATADKGVYTGENDTVELLGKVKLMQGVNTLEGVRAEMNLTTNLSRIYGDPNKGGRVKGVFFPNSQKSDKKS